MKANYKIIILKSIFFSLILLIVLFITFKKISALFPIPMIGNDKLVGFPQYYGYPLYFDTQFFFFIIFLPILILLFFYFWERRK